jgi:hypothetical protein
MPQTVQLHPAAAVQLADLWFVILSCASQTAQAALLLLKAPNGAASFQQHTTTPATKPVPLLSPTGQAFTQGHPRHSATTARGTAQAVAANMCQQSFQTPLTTLLSCRWV